MIIFMYLLLVIIFHIYSDLDPCFCSINGNNINTCILAKCFSKGYIIEIYNNVSNCFFVISLSDNFIAAGNVQLSYCYYAAHGSLNLLVLQSLIHNFY